MGFLSCWFLWWSRLPNLVTRIGRYWKMINVTVWWNWKKLLKSHKKTYITFFGYSCIAIFIFLLNWTPGRQRGWMTFFVDCSCRHRGVNNLSVGLFDELYQWAQDTSVFFSLLFFWKQLESFRGKEMVKNISSEMVLMMLLLVHYIDYSVVQLCC